MTWYITTRPRQKVKHEQVYAIVAFIIVFMMGAFAYGARVVFGPPLKPKADRQTTIPVDGRFHAPSTAFGNPLRGGPGSLGSPVLPIAPAIPLSPTIPMDRPVESR